MFIVPSCVKNKYRNDRQIVCCGHQHRTEQSYSSNTGEAFDLCKHWLVRIAGGDNRVETCPLQSAAVVIDFRKGSTPSAEYSVHFTYRRRRPERACTHYPHSTPVRNACRTFLSLDCAPYRAAAVDIMSPFTLIYPSQHNPHISECFR